MGGSDLAFLRVGDLAKKVGVCRETLLKIRKGDKDFPRPRLIYGDLYGWRSDEVDRWIESRPQADRGF